MNVAEGVLRIYTRQNVAAAGEMPVYRLVPKFSDEIYYEDRRFGYNRYYTALGHDQNITKMVRIYDEQVETQVETGDYAIIDGVQYLIDPVQPDRDEDGLKIRDLTLLKSEDYYDCVDE